MPRDTNGNYARPLSYVGSTKARASDVNTNENDLAAELSDSLSRSGKSRLLRPIGVDEGGTGGTTVDAAAQALGFADPPRRR